MPPTPPRGSDLRDQLDSAPAAARALLDTMVWGPPTAAIPASGDVKAAASWLIDHGLGMPSGLGHVALVREVALELRSGVIHRDAIMARPRPAGTPLDDHGRSGRGRAQRVNCSTGWTTSRKSGSATLRGCCARVVLGCAISRRSRRCSMYRPEPRSLSLSSPMRLTSSRAMATSFLSGCPPRHTRAGRPTPPRNVGPRWVERGETVRARHTSGHHDPEIADDRSADPGGGVPTRPPDPRDALRVLAAEPHGTPVTDTELVALTVAATTARSAPP